MSVPRRKRARTEEDKSSCSSSFASSSSISAKASTSDILRANAISTRLSALLNEFPEIKFIFDFELLQSITETAVVKYAEEKEAKKRNAQHLLNYRQNTVPLYSLPDEVLSNCLSYVGQGYYGVVGLVSKKLNEAYKDEFGQETAYLEMATSVNLASHCLNELCKSLEEKDEILKAAAVNGNLDILRAAVKDGYDLFPLIAMKKEIVFQEYNSDLDSDSDSLDYFFDVYYADDSEVNLSKLVERGHLHVLKYLNEELHYFLGLQRYCKPAIEYGQLEILEWLDYIGIMDELIKGDGLHIGHIGGNWETKIDFCDCAIQTGNVESLKWLMEKGYNIIGNELKVLADAIRSKSTDMIQYCFDIRSRYLNTSLIQNAIKGTKSVEVYRKMHELGYEFGEMKNWYENYRLGDYFEIIKFLRSISVPWDDGIMTDIVEYGTLEMIKYAHEDGCPWTGEEIRRVLVWTCKYSIEKFKYLIDNGCQVDYEKSSDWIDGLKRKKELELLDFFAGKNSSFDNELFKKFFACCDPWFEGISYLLEKGKGIQNFKSLEEVFQKRNKIDGIKYFHSLGLPWCLDSSKNTQLLSKIACYNDLEDVKWAYENGCKGGNIVPYVKEEWSRCEMKNMKPSEANPDLFEENELIEEIALERSGIKKLDQKIGDVKLESIHDWLFIDYALLKTLVDHGYMFASESEQKTVCKEVFQKCCDDSNKMKKDYRMRLALFVGMWARDL